MGSEISKAARKRLEELARPAELEEEKAPPAKGEPGYRPAHMERVGVRVCDTRCAYRQDGGPGCWDFRFGKAVDGGFCLPDMRKVEDWRKAYEGADGPEKIRADAGRLMGGLYVQAQRMLEDIDREGLTVKAPKCDVKGNPIEIEREDGLVDYIWEMRAHPLLEPLTRIVKLLGIDLEEFELTPSSEKSGGKLGGKLTGETKISIEVVMAEEKKRIAEVRAIAENASRLRAADPVYQKFAGEQPKPKARPVNDDGKKEAFPG